MEQISTRPKRQVPEEISVSAVEEPNLHRNPNWLTLHRYTSDLEKKVYCNQCHETKSKSSSDDKSFCSNSICHDRTWVNVDFDMIDNGPIFEEIVLHLPHYPSTQKPIESWGEGPSLEEFHREQVGLNCLDCHEEWPPLGPPPNNICLECHGGTTAGVAALTAKYDPNPHDWHYGDDMLCSQCHFNFGPYEPVDACGFCHTPKAISLIGKTAE